MIRYLQDKLFGREKKQHFLITSHGQTATLWLAIALNKHPKIFCTHAYSYPPAAAEEIHRLNASNERFWSLSVKDYFNELEAVNLIKPVMGNVHAFTYGRLTDLLSCLPKRQREKLTILNMIRHPVTRIVSMFKCWVSEEDEHAITSFVEKDFNSRCSHLRTFIDSRYTIQYNVQDITFIVCLLTMEDITKDVALAKKNGIFNIAYEKIIKNPIYFAEVIRKIMPTVDDKELSTMFSTEPVNQHNKQKKLSPREHYLQWQDWQRAAYDFIAKRHNFETVYSEYEHDFS